MLNVYLKILMTSLQVEKNFHMFIAMRSGLLPLIRSHEKDWEGFFLTTNPNPDPPPRATARICAVTIAQVLFYVQEDSDAVMNSIPEMGQQSKTEKNCRDKARALRKITYSFHHGKIKVYFCKLLQKHMY